ncbi:hypothetical protein VTH06DRAFT_3747 [Thermothelomyces fergusii]
MSPLFAHECAGMYEVDNELTEEEEDDAAHTPPPLGHIDPAKVDLNDPTLEHFPSSRDDIIETVQKLQTGLRADHPSFSCKPPSPAVNPSRRGTEDITGDFLLVNPQSPSSTPRRVSKHRHRGSTGSANATSSLHSISEDEEAVEDETNDRPAVVFSNPLKPRPHHLDIPPSNEDKGLTTQEGVSPKGFQPPRASVVSSDGSSPPSPKTVRKESRSADLASAEVELGRDKDRSMQEAGRSPTPPVDESGSGQADPNKGGEEGKKEDTEVTESPISYAGAAGTKSAEATAKTEDTPSCKTSEGPDESETTTSQGFRRRSYAEVAASKPAQVDAPSEGMLEGSKPPQAEQHPESSSSGGGGSEDKDKTAPSLSSPERPSYAEVAAPGSPPTQKTPLSPPLSREVSKAQPAPSIFPVGAESSTYQPAGVDTGIAGHDQDEGGFKSRNIQTAHTGGAGPLVVNFRYGAGWARAIFRLVLVDWVGGAVIRVLRLFGLDRLFGTEREE